MHWHLVVLIEEAEMDEMLQKMLQKHAQLMVDASMASCIPRAATILVAALWHSGTYSNCSCSQGHQHVYV